MSKNGLVVDGEGWFVVNARESRWKEEGPLGSYCTFEGKRRFPQLGLNVNVLEPGERLGLYHRERGQEAFLVLEGECTLIVEGTERTLRAWDFFHCPPGTEHVLLANGGQRAVVVAMGARRGGVVYVPCPAAARHGASVAHETRDASAAYAEARAGLPRSTFAPYREEWLSGPARSARSGGRSGP